MDRERDAIQNFVTPECFLKIQGGRPCELLPASFSILSNNINKPEILYKKFYKVRKQKFNENKYLRQERFGNKRLKKKLKCCLISSHNSTL